MKCENCDLENLAEASFCADCGTALISAVKPLLPLEPEAHSVPVAALEYIGFLTRFIATIIDVIIVWIISYALIFIISILPLEYLFLYSYLNSFFILLLYYWLFTGLKGQTPGKMVVGIKVVDSQGNKPGLVTAAIREILGKVISTIPLYLGFLWISWDIKKQGLHDKIATTYVIKA